MVKIVVGCMLLIASVTLGANENPFDNQMRNLAEIKSGGKQATTNQIPVKEESEKEKEVKEKEKQSSLQAREFDSSVKSAKKSISTYKANLKTMSSLFEASLKKYKKQMNCYGVVSYSNIGGKVVDIKVDYLNAVLKQLEENRVQREALQMNIEYIKKVLKKPNIEILIGATRKLSSVSSRILQSKGKAYFSPVISVKSSNTREIHEGEDLGSVKVKKITKNYIVLELKG